MNARCGGLVVALVLAGCGGNSAPVPKKDVVVRAAPKVTLFYPSPAAVAPGEKGLLCYGVEGAESVRIEPEVGSTSVAVSRCVPVTPKGTTTYTLTAAGPGGSATGSATVTVSAAAAKREAAGRETAVAGGSGGPEFTDLVVNAKAVKAGDLVSFCFQAKGAQSVQGGPGRFQKGGRAAGDCLLDQPKKTTRYTLTLVGADGGRTTEAVSVTVRQ